MSLLSGLECTRDYVQNICREIKDTVSTWYNQHLSPETSTTHSNGNIDFVPLAHNKGVWGELRKEHELLSVEHENVKELLGSLRQVITQLQTDYLNAKQSLVFRRYTLLKAMIKRCVVYIHLRGQGAPGEKFTTGKQRQEMRNREESISGLSRQELVTLNKQLDVLIKSDRCKTALIMDTLRTLEQGYEQSKNYNALRRYTILKNIVKAVIHNQWLQE